MEVDGEEKIVLPNIKLNSWRSWAAFPKLKKLYGDWYRKRIKQQLIRTVFIVLLTYMAFYLILPKVPSKPKELQPLQSSLDYYEPTWNNWFVSINDSAAIKVNRTLTPTLADALPFDAWGLLDENMWVLPIPKEKSNNNIGNSAENVRLLIIIDKDGKSKKGELLLAKAMYLHQIPSIPSTLLENNPEFYPFIIEPYDPYFVRLISNIIKTTAYLLISYHFFLYIINLTLEYFSLKTSSFVSELRRYADQLKMDPVLILVSMENDLVNERSYSLGKIVFTKNWVFLMDDYLFFFSIHNIEVKKFSKPSRTRMSTENFLKFNSIVGNKSITIKDRAEILNKMYKSINSMIEEQLESILTNNEKETDHYEVLGLEHGASIVEIKKAYKSRAKQLHPDRNPNPKAKEMWVKVCQSYELLMSETKKEAFDEYVMKKRNSSGSLKRSSSASSSSVSSANDTNTDNID